VPTFSSCVAGETNRLITAIAPAIGATQTTIDVGGAYYHGTPGPIESGGRYIFARIPPWLSAMYPERYPARDRTGKPNFLRVIGNMPGRCDGGRIWQRRLNIFLRASDSLSSSRTAAPGFAATTSVFSSSTTTSTTHA
jgi:hypothetical protein